MTNGFLAIIKGSYSGKCNRNVIVSIQKYYKLVPFDPESTLITSRF
jgi:hypothetical protein